MSSQTLWRQRSARLAAGLMAVHGLIEVAGLVFAGYAAQTLQTFGSLGPAQLAANSMTIGLFGGLWGAGRWLAAWGVWSLRKWAVALGIILCVTTLVSALSIIPAGVSDTLLALPALGALLWAWFGGERLAEG